MLLFLALFTIMLCYAYLTEYTYLGNCYNTKKNYISEHHTWKICTYKQTQENR